MRNRYLTLLLWGTTLLFLSACGITSRVSREASSPPTGEFNRVIETGVASWYGPNFHGKMTANGEIYNMNSLTAAHRTLPFNTFVRVENIDNDKSVIVRINDRGPFKDNRIIDLSKKAAREIEMIGPGTADVQLYLVKGDSREIEEKDLKVSTYTVQLGSFQQEENALEISNNIRGARVEQHILNSGEEVFRVYYGIFTDKSEAEKERQKLARDGFNGYVKQLENS
ncbi:MAG: septal ring lytic transglycosylase RlpA family protein [Balneolaceae bacterium]|nr:septal ring lytic transglycosylase RlpA family protein [Balneolaceae bacterium]